MLSSNITWKEYNIRTSYVFLNSSRSEIGIHLKKFSVFNRNYISVIQPRSATNYAMSSLKSLV